jgi:hypothetical protein
MVMSSPAVPTVLAGSLPKARFSLYGAGAIAAIGVVALIPLQAAVFVAWPTPTTVAEAFTLFQQNALAGLLAFDLLLMLSWLLSLLVFVALYKALRREAPNLTLVALVLQASAFAIYFSSNTAFSLLGLSGQQAGATSETERSAILAAGQAMLALYTGTAFNVSYVLSGVSALLMGLAAVRSTVFARRMGYAVIVYALLQIPPTAGAIGMTLALVSLVPMIVWLILAARGLIRLTAASSPEPWGSAS